jgi:hypothetical protein
LTPGFIAGPSDKGPTSVTVTPIKIGEPVAVDAPVEAGAAPVAALVAGLLGAAVVGLAVFDEEPHADTRATPAKALPAMAKVLRPRFVIPRRRRPGVAPVVPSALPSCVLPNRCLMVKFFLSGGIVDPA